jgi:uncharacterized RDD family membrane protein YckC
MDSFEFEEKLYREDIKLAPVDKRVLAHVIDDFILSALLFIIISDTISNSSSVEEVIIFINSLIFEFMVIKLIYHAVFTSIYGGSIGKILMKIKVVSIEDFSNVSILSSLNRSFVRLFSEAVFYLGFLWAFFDPYRQSWHDKSSKTIVIYAN